jgi:hypothetical protein
MLIDVELYIDRPTEDVLIFIKPFLFGLEFLKLLNYLIGKSILKHLMDTALSCRLNPLQTFILYINYDWKLYFSLRKV